MFTQNSTLMEVQLIHQVAKGDQAAFGLLYDHYSKPLFSFAVKILNDHKEAEDVLQEAFLKIWDKAATFDEGLSTPFTWVAVVTRNKAIDRLRTRQQYFRLFRETTDDDMLIMLGGKSPADEHIKREHATNIRRAMGELPSNQRRPIELAFFKGLTHIEIAEALMEPLGTIKARIRRGIRRLRTVLEGANSFDHEMLSRVNKPLEPV